jgi:hypothetical protein
MQGPGSRAVHLVISARREHTAPSAMTAEELEKRIGELAREFAKTHDKEVEAELEALRARVAAMRRRLI